MKYIVQIAALYLVFWLIAPLLSPYDPLTTNATNTLQAPNTAHLLGTDNLGRDVLSRTLHGGQRTLLIAALALTVAIVPALVLSLLTYYAQWIDTALGMLNTVFLAIPSLLLALVVLTLLGTGTMSIAIATGIAQSPFYFQVARSVIQQETIREYVLSAQSLGATRWHILTRHILPNSRPTLVAYAGVTFSYCIINSAALSLLGLGGDPSLPDWGSMLATGRTTFRVAPWAAVAPAVAISMTVILINKLADTFR